MNNKEKVQLFSQTIKQLAKSKNWKFKSNFTFKQKGNFFYESVFSIHPKENRIRGWLAFKPVSVDDTFWEITKMEENKKMPLSFRGDAAFKVSSLFIYEFDNFLTDGDNPTNEINALLETLDIKVAEVENEIITTEQFLTLLEKSKYNKAVEIITCLIELKEFEKALEKISFYREKNINSKFTFINKNIPGSKDFYDFAEEFCENKLGKLQSR